MKRFRLPLLIGTVLSLFAFLCAGSVNQGVARFALAVPDGETIENFSAGGGGPAVADSDGGGSAEDPDKKPRTTSRGKASYSNGILGRNIFDSTAIGKSVVSEEGDDDLSNLKVKLLATMVAKPASFSSCYLVREGDDTSGAAYSIGDKILGAEIVAIAEKEIRIRKPGEDEDEVIRLHVDKDEKRPTTSKPAAGDDDEGISKDGDNEYSVDKSLVDKYLNDLEGISRLGRAIPHRGPDGEIDGYRLSGIRRGTVGEKLGIRNGDIVHKVNGYDLTSMSEAMKAFQELQSDDNFSFELTRRGKQQTNKYSVK